MTTKLQKLYSLPRNLRAGNKLPAIFLKKPLCMGDLSYACKIFIERPGMCIQYVSLMLTSYQSKHLNILSYLFIHGVTRKRSTNRLRHTGNLFRKNLQLKDAC